MAMYAVSLLAASMPKSLPAICGILFQIPLALLLGGGGIAQNLVSMEEPPIFSTVFPHFMYVEGSSPQPRQRAFIQGGILSLSQ